MMSVWELLFLIVGCLVLGPLLVYVMNKLGDDL